MEIFHKMAKRIGHRGAFLALVAAAFILYGLGLFYEPSSYHHADFFLSFEWWPRIFFATGAAMFLTGVSGPTRDSYAFGVSAFISAWWAIRWFHSWIVEGVPGDWPVAFTWVLISAIILLVATWPEETNRRRRKKWEKGDG